MGSNKSDVTPTKAINDLSDCSPAYSEQFCKSSLRGTVGMLLTNIYDLRSSQFRRSIFLAVLALLWMSISSVCFAARGAFGMILKTVPVLSNHVISIIGARATKQMVRIYTRGIVARMANLHSFLDFTKCHQIGKAVCCITFVPNRQAAITTAGCRSCPNPAIICLFYMFPKVFGLFRCQFHFNLALKTVTPRRAGGELVTVTPIQTQRGKRQARIELAVSSMARWRISTLLLPRKKKTAERIGCVTVTQSV